MHVETMNAVPEYRKETARQFSLTQQRKEEPFPPSARVRGFHGYICVKKIAFMTGGGDCAGINSFIANAVKLGTSRHGVEFIGIRQAFEGASSECIEEYVVPFCTDGLLDLENRPSTVLASSRFNPFSEANQAKGCPARLVDNLRRIGVDAVLATGGNDTIKSALELHRMGIPVIAAPKSIDNDVSGTDVMLGFKTAVSFGSVAFRSTVESARTHRRISLVEVMGREAGWLALEIGVAGGADVILIPEKPVDLSMLCDTIRSVCSRQGYANIAVAEGVRVAGDDPILMEAQEKSPVVKALLSENPGMDEHGNRKLGGMAQILRRILVIKLGLRSLEDVRTSDIGFHLRGLAPIADDIILGARFAHAALDLVMSGESGKMVGLQGTRVVPVPMEDALVPRPVDWSDDELRSAGVLLG